MARVQPGWDRWKGLPGDCPRILGIAVENQEKAFVVGEVEVDRSRRVSPGV